MKFVVRKTGSLELGTSQEMELAIDVNYQLFPTRREAVRAIMEDWSPEIRGQEQVHIERHYQKQLRNLRQFKVAKVLV